MKYPRASGALRWALDPMLKRARFTRTMLLRTVGNLGLLRSGPPPDQILDPPLKTIRNTWTDIDLLQITIDCKVKIYFNFDIIGT